jgi:hypothetical protein
MIAIMVATMMIIIYRMMVIMNGQEKEHWI